VGISLLYIRLRTLRAQSGFLPLVISCIFIDIWPGVGHNLDFGGLELTAAIGFEEILLDEIRPVGMGQEISFSREKNLRIIIP